MATNQVRRVVFNRVAENLYRLETSGGYYALLKRGDKQFRRSLRTGDRKLAERRLAELRAQVGNLSVSEDARLSFPEIAERWMQATAHTLKESTITRRRTCIKNLTPFFASITIRNVQPQHCERWLTERAAKIAPQTMAHELNTMRAVFEYAVERGLMLQNPARGIKRKRVVLNPLTIPTREQFKQLIGHHPPVRRPRRQPAEGRPWRRPGGAAGLFRVPDTRSCFPPMVRRGLREEHSDDHRRRAGHKEP